MLRVSVIAFVACIMCSRAFAQLPLIREAEDCQIACKAGGEAQKNIWARGQKHTPAFWGRDTADSLVWEVNFKEPHGDLSLGVRYSYAHGHYGSFFPVNAKRVLYLIVDGKSPIAVKVPDTGWWDLFETTAVRLPKLAAGAHTLKIVPPEADMTTNIDTLVIFSGKLQSLPATLRGTTIATSPSKHFVLRTTPDAKMTMKPEEVFRQFEMIYDHYRDFMGWEFPGVIPINIIDDDKWPSNATAFQNAGGVFFRAAAMATEQGNWVHEMTHMFYVAHFPGWFDEPSVRMLTTLVWWPDLFGSKTNPDADPAYSAAITSGKEMLRNPSQTCDDIGVLLNTLAVKYGATVYSRFFNACADAGKRGELDFKPGRWMTRDEIVKYMSQAAGEDVTPLFRRWNGYGGAQ